MYAPNLKAEKNFLFCLMFENLNDFEGRKVVMENFNSVVNNDVGIVSGNPHCTQDEQRFRQTMPRLNVIDVWRVLHADEKAYMWWWWWSDAWCPQMSVDILGTSCDQCRSMVQYSFTSTETRRLARTDSPGRPPRLSHSSWTMLYVEQGSALYSSYSFVYCFLSSGAVWE